MEFTGFILVLLALIGHGYLWAAYFNLLHGVAISKKVSEPLTAVGFACAVWIPVGLGAWLVWGGNHDWPAVAWLSRVYVGVCAIAGGVTTARWVRWHVLARPSPIVRHNRTEPVDLRQSAGPGSSGRRDHHFLARLPGNEMLQLNVVERALNVPRLPAALDGISILHLSDFHFSGRIGKAYFEEVVRVSNRLEPDLVAMTGDFVDRSACIDWVPDTLGKLAGRAGTWFVLGNHDLRVDTDRLRRTLLDSGLIGVGGRWTEIRVRGEPVILAGNELPWISPAADLATAPPRSADGGPVRIALAHSPDQLGWARANGVDLLLTGHTHGGQIRIPLIGPLLSATRLGVRYCCGPYDVPPTILHVTSGVSSVIPVRLLCPPEIVKLVLHSAL